MVETTRTFTDQAPWSGVQPFLGYGFEQAQRNYIESTPQYFPDPTFLPFNPNQLSALQGIKDVSGENIFGQLASAEAAKTLGGEYLTENPFLDAISQRVAADAANQVTSAFSGGGRYGSGAHADALSRSVADAVAAQRFSAYGDERARMMNALQLAPQTDPLQYANLNQLMGVGDVQAAKSQQELQDKINRFTWDQSQPDLQLSNYMKALGGNYGQSTTEIQQSPTYGGNTAQNVIGGGMLGYGLGQASGYGIPGAIAGGVLGGLFT